ncbi:carboxylesterase family protein [Nonomuraea sp. NPDC050153]|uniref:carboxylesterase family protein n=1 Tax=Nonomuraea sp. NPDC050153 TaxID=3364359 RepID=UPI0037A5637B
MRNCVFERDTRRTIRPASITPALQYLFSGAYAGHALSPEQRQLSDQMISYWTRFAHAGNPNGDQAPAWAKYRPADGQVLALAPGQDGIKEVNLDREHRCDFWKSVE